MEPRGVGVADFATSQMFLSMGFFYMKSKAMIFLMYPHSTLPGVAAEKIDQKAFLI